MVVSVNLKGDPCVRGDEDSMSSVSEGLVGTTSYRLKQHGARSPNSHLAEGLSILSREKYYFCASELFGINSNSLYLATSWGIERN